MPTQAYNFDLFSMQGIPSSTARTSLTVPQVASCKMALLAPMKALGPEPHALQLPIRYSIAILNFRQQYVSNVGKPSIVPSQHKLA